MAPTSAAPRGGPHERVGVIVVAAGKSRRMEGVDKTFACVRGLPLVAYTLDHFEAFPPVTEISLVLDSDSLERGRRLVASRGYQKVTGVCAGGERRQDSVRRGLESLVPCDWVMVHDGARPCLDQSMLRRGLEAVRECGAVVAGVPVKDTIKVVSSVPPVSPSVSHWEVVTSTPDRGTLRAAQTPQIFRYDLLQEAHQRCAQTFTDDAAMVESLGHPVKMFLGSYRNLKVTTPEDLAIVEVFLQAGAGV